MILTSGCFDGLHIGHLRYLQAAKALDPTRTLVVAVASDRYMRTRKRREPVWSQDDRIALIFALSIVDRVVLHGAEGAAESILDLKPVMFVKGMDWSGRLPGDVQRACHMVGTQAVFVDSQIHRHTSDALSPILA